MVYAPKRSQCDFPPSQELCIYASFRAKHPPLYSAASLISGRRLCGRPSLTICFGINVLGRTLPREMCWTILRWTCPASVP